MVGKRPAAEKIDYFLGDPLAIGPVEVPNRVVLAPMSGITDAPFRRLAERLGAGLVVSEMTACAGLDQPSAARVQASGSMWCNSQDACLQCAYRFR
jgi:tRNA-dihydrouridine synthase B